MRWLSLLFAILCSHFLHAQTWSSSGPFGGYITAIAIDPADTNIVYAGTYGGGVFKSLDRGENWVEINNGFPQREDSTIGDPTEPSWWFGDYYPVTALQFAPDEHLHLYAGMWGGGIAQSFDGGNSWIATNDGLPDSSIIQALWIHPQDPNFLLCGTNLPSGGLYRSTDGGNHWSLVDNFPNGATYYITTIVNDPTNPENIFAGFSSAGEPGLSWGIMHTNDRGSTWTIVNQDFTFYDLQIDPVDPQKFWSVVATGFLEWRLFYSTDGGSTWSPYPDVQNAWNDIWTMYADHHWNLYVIDNVDIPGPNVQVLRKSTDHGQSWTTTSLQLPLYPRSEIPLPGPRFAANPFNSRNIYLSSEVGVYRSEDGGETFSIYENGMINTYIYEVAVNPKNPQIVYAGGRKGFWKSDDGGSTWLRLSTASTTSIAIDPQHPDTLYRGGDDLMRSFDGGNTWVDIKGMIPGVITDIAIREDTPYILYVSNYNFITSSLFKSEDYGSTWTQIFSSSPAGFRIESITIDKYDPQIMYFGAMNNLFDHGLYKSMNSGQTWKKISDPGEVISIALKSGSSDTLFVATTEKVHVSFDAGVTFSEIGQEIPSTHMSKVLVNPFLPSTVFAGTRDKGIFFSNDLGNSWQPLNGDYDARITDIDVVFPGKIFAATHGAGVWRGDDVVVGIPSFNVPSTLSATKIQLLPPYPNPFNNRTRISFYLPQSAFVELSVFNNLGQKVKMLARDYFTAGQHQLYWDGTDDRNKTVASGNYFIQLHNNGKTLTQRLLWVK